VSVLLAGIEGRVGAAIVARLISQNDEVRVIEADASAAGEWGTLGAHVARGSSGDADLVERAAQNVRTLVVGPGAAGEETMRALVEGAELAGVERIVLFGPRLRDEIVAIVRASELQRVLLATGRRVPWGGRRVDDAALAEAIDAADDLSGEVRLELDLADPGAWRRLGLEPR
jgi:hypothetical protein